MEDWGYSASWENLAINGLKPIKECNPYSYSGYPSYKTQYDSVSIRPMVYIVECFFDKKPKESTLGNDNKYIFNNGKVFLFLFQFYKIMIFMDIYQGI